MTPKKIINETKEGHDLCPNEEMGLKHEPSPLKPLNNIKDLMFILWDKVSHCNPGWAGDDFVAQANLKLNILL